MVSEIGSKLLTTPLCDSWDCANGCEVVSKPSNEYRNPCAAIACIPTYLYLYLVEVSLLRWRTYDFFTINMKKILKNSVWQQKRDASSERPVARYYDNSENLNH